MSETEGTKPNEYALPCGDTQGAKWNYEKHTWECVVCHKAFTLADLGETPTPHDPPEETVGDIMKKSSGEGVKFWVIVVSVIVYLAGVVYAEVHGLTMLTKGVAPDMRIWAQLGMIAAGISAVALPVALKVWTIESKQRLGAYMFYALDFAFLVFNAFTDFNVQTGQQLLPWAQAYVSYVLPASPIIVAAFWALIWELDPTVKESVLKLSLRAAMKQKLAHKVAEAARGANVTARVSEAADQEVERALTELFGQPVTAYRVDTTAQAGASVGGLLRSFFGSLLERAQRAYLSDMPSQPQPSPSEPTNPNQP
jgi:hypothetical protein